MMEWMITSLALTALLIPQLLGMSRAEMNEKIRKLRARVA